MSGEHFKEQLDNCAHCGGKAIGWVWDSGWGLDANVVEIWCERKGCYSKMSFGVARGKKELAAKIKLARKKWNRRHK